ncbi:unnamed protein product [Urochloa decumbens]|uniref:Transcription repressor n=1 Tax=Urochloa decumbens TaxID=240449 RepID=A0ABC8ZBN7_9POAL
MDHGGGGGGGRSSSRLRERLARMFRPTSLLRSTCNTNASTCSSSSSSSTAAAAAGASTKAAPPPPTASACSSSRALLAADAAVARDRDSFLASSRRDFAASLVGRTESFSTAIDRLHHRRAGAAPLPPSRFSVDAPPLMEANKKDKSPREYRLGVKGNSGDKMKTKLLSNPYGFTTSDDDDTDVFSSDAEDDLAARAGKKLSESAETFFCSSRSFSSDSSEFYTTTTNNKKKKTNKSPAAATASTKPLPKQKPPKRGRGRRVAASGGCDTCGVRDGFRPVVCAAEEQVRRGFAVVKRSRDPYADFRSSMVEMIVGRQLFGAPDMERLLRSYLSLNAPRHHPVILQAFSDIWVVVHGG